MTICLKSSTTVFIVSQMRRCNIYSIHCLQEFLVIIERLLQPVFITECIGSGLIWIENGHSLHPTHHLALWHKTTCNTASTHNSNTMTPIGCSSKLRRRYTFCSWKVDHLAVLVQVIEFTLPVRPDGEYINSILLYIINLLTHIILYNHLICIARGFNGIHTF